MTQNRSAHDDIIVRRGATWADYQRMKEMRGDSSAPRMAYLEGVIEVTRPSHSHESIKSMVGCLVEAWCRQVGVEITPYGSWTLEAKALERGVEPDECYVLGDVAEPERPDLAIEIVERQGDREGDIDRLEIYRRLGVREVWIWKQGRIDPFLLRGDHFELAKASAALPGIDLDLLARFVSVLPMTRAVREYVAALGAEATD